MTTFTGPFSLYRWIPAALLAILGTAVPIVAAPPTNPQALPMLGIQVQLARAHFSPGEIDGKGGPNTDRAITAFEAARNLPAGDTAKLLDALGGEGVEAVTTYTITEEDVAGPFVRLPEDLMDKAKLPRLGYQSALEALGEKFHAATVLLTQLNPHAKFAAGEEIRVPDVLSIAELTPPATVTITVSKRTSALTVADADGRTIFHAPVTTGSEHDPLPLGPWVVTAIVRNPTFNYNPDLFWDAEPTHAKARIPAGPNSPVGLVWIDISKPHYGIHGTPEPRTVGHTESHGCVRLTNWDATTLAGLVAKGTKVLFTE
ncbi:MAG: L,D-transpeptidase family protein [Vicinamibacterales bacterium]